MQANADNNKAHNPILAGALVAGIGVAVALLINLQPGGLRVPLWVAMLACLCFVFAGGALAIRPQTNPLMHQCMVLAILTTMTAIPAWISLGPGERHCSSNVPFFSGATSCRVVFGLSTLCMVLLLAIAIKQAWQLFKARS